MTEEQITKMVRVLSAAHLSIVQAQCVMLLRNYQMMERGVSLKSLSRKTGISVSGVRVALRKLTEQRMIETEVSSRGPRRYRLTGYGERVHKNLQEL